MYSFTSTQVPYDSLAQSECTADDQIALDALQSAK